MPDERLERELERPDPLADVPARYLSGPGFALRLLRLIERDRRLIGAEALLDAVRRQCEDAAVALWPPREDEVDGG